MSTDYKFQGWMGEPISTQSHMYGIRFARLILLSGLDKDSHKGNLVWKEFEPKTWEETDVDIKITHCGICASDVHTLSSGWGPTPYPICVGHEVVGTIVRIGSKAEAGLKIGDRVGVGAQCGSCLSCHRCKTDMEQYCDQGQIFTYTGRYPDGTISQGGYGDYIRVPSHFAIPIPEGLPSDVAAPMLCGGITVYSPLKHNGAGTTAKNVGIVGIGGLGHFGLLFAKAMGAEVTAISHSEKKKADALEMGATHFINTSEQDWDQKNKRTLDLIISTSNDESIPFDKYLNLLKPYGRMVLVGVPSNWKVEVGLWTLLINGVFIGASAIGTPVDIREMLELAAKQNIKTWIEPYPMDKVNDALNDFNERGMRYRAVLYNHKHIEEEK
ncbi:zinc-binding alcohol dehydrogenase [Planoprotostelium fungivorum]|uniref:alcohol dehydrogenase (NADP(+)) n=1 Tax=Planoprotostelium fungivorum TaxID=1890364 RepID=A0A2P6NUX1_9EUKA|nr:zinc-binding alcohol dehydrogenase [Planoprotostelium fungivorum]